MKNITAFLVFILAFSIFSIAAEVKDFDITITEALGRKIYDQDIIAAEATDILFAQNLDLSQYPIRGWVVEERNQKTIVTFIGEYDGEFFAIFEISKQGKQKATFTNLDKSELSAYQAAVFAARTLAMQNIKKPCSDRYNFVIVKNPIDQGFLVYALAATVDPNAVIVGGHYRFSVSQDGKNLEKAERLSASCLTLDKSTQNLPAGATSVGFMVTSSVSERPLEIHVFLSLLHQIDLFVSTSTEKVWLVQNGRIEKIQLDNQTGDGNFE
jgi:hypothetical protein